MRLDVYLEKHSIPVEEFADKVGVHRASIYRFMKGLSFPRPLTLQKIKKATGNVVTADDFVDVLPNQKKTGS
jgi:transcriptional regulator with XRE-family HTH domain